MKYVGIDLHKKTISGCVVVKERGKKKVAARKRLECRDEAGIKSWFSELGKFEVVVEATASYEWFVKLVEPLAQRVVLAHPKKLRIIAESKRKSDKLDAQVLAEEFVEERVVVANAFPEGYTGIEAEGAYYNVLGDSFGGGAGRRFGGTGGVYR